MPSTPTKGGPSTIARRQHHHHHHLDSGGGGAACSAADDGKGHAEEADHHRHQLTVAVRLFIRQALHLPHSDSVHTAGTFARTRQADAPLGHPAVALCCQPLPLWALSIPTGSSHRDANRGRRCMRRRGF